MQLFKNTIINFHGIKDEKWLENVFNLLLRRYTVIPIAEIESYYYQKKTLNNVCHITFDDGEKNFYEKVFPLLIKYQIPVSLYVSPFAIQTGKNFWFQEIRGYDQKLYRQIVSKKFYIDKIKNFEKIPLKLLLKSLTLESIWDTIDEYRSLTNTFLKPPININVDQLKELHRSGLVEIGAHTQNHPILKNESDEIAKREITESVKQLGELLNNEIRYFAYPNGDPSFDFGKREIDILKSVGIKLAFSTEASGLLNNNNPFAIPRIGFSYGNKSFILSKLVFVNKWEILKSLFGKDVEKQRNLLIRKVLNDSKNFI